MNDRLTDLRSRRTGYKWAEHGADVIPAWVADMDFSIAPAVVEALEGWLAEGDFGYTHPDDADLVTEAGRRWYADHHGWDPDPTRMRVFGDVMQGVAAAIEAFTEPGDGVILQTPVYHPFWWAIEGAHRRIVEAPLTDREDGYRVTRAALESAVAAGGKLLLFANPHNPTGRVFSAEELATIADVAEAHDLVIVADEIHADLVYEPHRHIPLAAFSSAAAARLVTLFSPSKAFNLAGVACAVGVSGTLAMDEAFDRLPTWLMGHVRRSAMLAATAAWTHGEPWLAETREVLAANRERVAEWVTGDRRVGFRAPDATYLAWLDFRPQGWDTEPAHRLLEQAGVALSPGTQFGGAGHARLNFATYPEVLDEILRRLGTALEED